MPCNVSYFNKDGKLYWKCPNNMGPQTAREMTSTKCWKYNCPGRKAVEPSSYCAYELCNNLKRAGSKYCADACRKRKSRRDYKLRQKKL